LNHLPGWHRQGGVPCLRRASFAEVATKAGEALRAGRAPFCRAGTENFIKFSKIFWVLQHSYKVFQVHGSFKRICRLWNYYHTTLLIRDIGSAGEEIESEASELWSPGSHHSRICGRKNCEGQKGKPSIYWPTK